MGQTGTSIRQVTPRIPPKNNSNKTPSVSRQIPSSLLEVSCHFRHTSNSNSNGFEQQSHYLVKYDKSMLSIPARLLPRCRLAKLAAVPTRQWTLRSLSSAAASPPPDVDDLHLKKPMNNVFNPTEEHLTLRSMLRSFVANEASHVLYRFSWNFQLHHAHMGHCF